MLGGIYRSVLMSSADLNVNTDNYGAGYAHEAIQDLLPRADSHTVDSLVSITAEACSRKSCES